MPACSSLEIFALFMLSGIFSTLLLPETKGKSLEELSNENQDQFVQGMIYFSIRVGNGIDDLLFAHRCPRVTCQQGGRPRTRCMSWPCFPIWRVYFMARNFFIQTLCFMPLTTRACLLGIYNFCLL